MGREEQRGPRAVLEQRLQDLLFGSRIHTREGVVEQEHRPLQRQSTRQRDTLLLSARQGDPPLADHGVEAAGEGLQIAPQTGARKWTLGRGHGAVLIEPERHVRADGVGEEEALLRHDPVHPSQVRARPLARIAPAHQDGALRRIEQPCQQCEQGGLPRAGAADDGDPLPRRHRKVQAAQDEPVRGGVLESDVLELDRDALPLRPPQPGRLEILLDRLVHDGADPGHGGFATLEEIRDPAQRNHGPQQHRQIDLEGDQIP